MYKCHYFRIFELVDPTTYKARGQKAWELFDPRLLKAIDELRNVFGPATINSWKWGGQYKYSGYRPKWCKTGATYSQHRMGRAADLKFSSVSPQEVRADIRGDWEYWARQGINCVENATKTWLHVDVRNCEPIKWVNP